MKKQELIERIEDLSYREGLIIDTIKISRKGLLELVNQLDEPQPVKVPQFVADFIAEQKKLGHTLSYSIDASMSDRVAEWYWDNSELFALAWLDDHEAEKEKKYKVVLLNYNDGHLNLVNVRTLGENIIFFTKKTQFDPRSLKLTKAEIISSGFGWVFDCPGVQIEEVE